MSKKRYGKIFLKILKLFFEELMILIILNIIAFDIIMVHDY